MEFFEKFNKESISTQSKTLQNAVIQNKVYEKLSWRILLKIWI